MSGATPKLRLDKWLWFARFWKTRTLAAGCISEDGVRVNGQIVRKPSYCIGAGDILTFTQGDRVRVIEVMELAERRGPATEAQALYADRSPPVVKKDSTPENPAFEGRGRPTKKDRRQFDLSRDRRLE